MLHLPPPVHGSTIVGKLVKESNLLNDSFRGRYINLILSDNVDESGKTSPKKLLRVIITWFNLLAKLLHQKPDLCYYALTTTGSAFYKDVLMIALLQFFRVKIVYHIHNKGMVQARKRKLNNRLYRFVFKNAYVILLSRHLYNEVEPYVPEGQLFCCPNGVKDCESGSANPNLSDDKSFNILFLSNLMKEKGVFVLLDACSILRNKGLSFHCDFVGGEGDISAKEFEAHVRERGLEKQVKYLGKRYGQLKDKSFEQADVFVLPSQRDCFPLVVLEAMQHSLPVIATYEGGIPDMVDVEDTGFLFSPFDVDGLVQKLELLHSNPELGRQMGVNGRRKYEQNFTLPIFEQRLLNILQEVINK